MTTIVYSKGIIAVDCRVTRGNTIDTDDCDKRLVQDGREFFLSGCGPDFQALIDDYLGIAKNKSSLDATGIVVDGGVLWQIGFDNTFRKLWKEIVPPTQDFAIGSGRDFALAALDMGADAVKAVEAAAKRDIYTGGTIRTYTVEIKANG